MTKVRRWSAVLANGHIQHEIKGLEAAADTLMIFQSSLVPGLLQTEDYIRVLHARDEMASDVEAFVAGRLARQNVVTTGAKPAEFLIMEEALRWPADSPETLGPQLEYIADISDLDNVTISVIPTGMSPVPPPQYFTLLEGPMPQVRAETLHAQLVMTHALDVDPWRDVWNRLAPAALSPDETREFLHRIRAELSR